MMNEPTLERAEQEISEAVADHPDPTGRVLYVLRSLQKSFGYVPPETLPLAARALDVSQDQLESVCEFFGEISTERPGKHIVVVCDGTACHTKGSRDLVQVLERVLDVKVGQTTPDGEYTLKTVPCLGSCSCAPMMLIDGKPYSHVSLTDAAQVKRLITDVR